MPVVKNHNATMGVPKTRGIHAGCQFSEVDQIFPERNLKIIGITKDLSGVVLGNCQLLLMNNTDKNGMQFGESDANGNYIMPIAKRIDQPQTTTWMLIAYKPGSPDVAGTTINTLTGV